MKEAKVLEDLTDSALYDIYINIAHSRFRNWKVRLSNIYAYVYMKEHRLDRMKEKHWRVIDSMEERSTIIDYLNLIDYSMDINGNIYNEKDQCVFANKDEGTGNNYDENGIYIGKL